MMHMVGVAISVTVCPDQIKLIMDAVSAEQKRVPKATRCLAAFARKLSSAVGGGVNIIGDDIVTAYHVVHAASVQVTKANEQTVNALRESLCLAYDRYRFSRGFRF